MFFCGVGCVSSPFGVLHAYLVLAWLFGTRSVRGGSIHPLSLCCDLPLPTLGSRELTPPPRAHPRTGADYGLRGARRRSTTAARGARRRTGRSTRRRASRRGAIAPRRAEGLPGGTRRTSFKALGPAVEVPGSMTPLCTSGVSD